MRYKIGFEFPFFSQKNIQYAHSHFAFAGWVAQALYVLILRFTLLNNIVINARRYNIALIFNLCCSYGMLVSFFIQGYQFISIFFSTGTIIVAYYYTYIFFEDIKKNSFAHNSIVWFKSALWFNIFSTFGTFYLAYMMSSGRFNEHHYLASIYFYLHFQYNGFFIFTCIGLLLQEINNYLPSFKYEKKTFHLFFWACIPCYFLSILWAELPLWLYVLIVIAAFAQLLAWVLLLKEIRKSLSTLQHLTAISKIAFFFIGICFSIKLILQLGSTIPSLSDLAYGFRPVVIAYLHLVLLAVISIFLIAFMYATKLIPNNKISRTSIALLILGILLNELILAIQGIYAFSYSSIPMVNENLFVVSIIIVSALFLLNVSFRRKEIA